MATRDEVIATLKAKGYNGPIPEEQTPVNPIQNALKNVLGGAYAGFTGTSLPTPDSGLDQEYKRTQINSLKAGMTVDPATGLPTKTTDIARDEREGRLREFEARRQAASLRGELTQNPYIKRFQEMNSAATGIDSILSDTLSRADNQSKNVGDQALITLYNKILDPLSVVRESEYARTPEGQSLLNRIGGYVQKVQAGGSGLTDADRVEIARAAKVLINNAGELFNTKLGDYENLATGYGVPDTQLVTGGYQRFSPYDIDKQYGAPQPVLPDQSGGVPSVGGTFEGKRVVAVRKKAR